MGLTAGTPRLYAPVADTKGPNAFSNFKGWEAALKANQAELDACDQEAQDAWRLTGRYFYESVADGYAFYQIVRENKKTVRIRHCLGVAADDYQVHVWGPEASIPTALAQRLVDRHAAIARLFGKGGL